MEENKTIVSVGAVIENDAGEILLVKHKPEREGYWKGKWICPGGKLKVGEKIEEGIKREVFEETHLNIQLTKPLVPFERIVKSDGKTILHVIYIDYEAKLESGVLIPDDDVGEAMWVKKEKIFDLSNELHDDTKKLLELTGIYHGI
ncbi:MAG: NUDIX domain-containing protein [Thermodesulfobacteriota bacterium]|nr:NUDIX domain-containing protein [Thermodesulfobacteriota bacterium]